MDDSRLIISVKEARKLLGKEHASMTDEQVENLIIQLDEIARLSFKQSIERIRNGEPIINTMPIKLDDIYYFREKKLSHPAVYNLAKDVRDLSQTNSTDKSLFQAKLDKLATVPGNNDEQRRMAGDLLCEFQTYKILHDAGVNPHWVEETTNRQPDLEYEKNGESYPVEVKHINPPRAEDIALSRGVSIGGSVDTNYIQGVVQKIQDNVTSAKNKFNTFNGDTANNGTLYLYYSQSIDAQVASYFPGSQPMQSKVEQIVSSISPSGMDVVVQDINSFFT